MVFGLWYSVPVATNYTLLYLIYGFKRQLSPQDGVHLHITKPHPLQTLHIEVLSIKTIHSGFLSECINQGTLLAT